MPADPPVEPAAAPAAPAARPVPHRRTPRRRAALPILGGTLIAAAGLLFGALTAGASPDAGAHHHPDPVPSLAPTPSPPRQGDAIPNVTRVENEIKAYYGDTVVGTDHLPSPTGLYAQEVTRIESGADGYLAHEAHHHGSKPAIVLDVDDTSLNTYNYEIFSSFAYNPATNAEYVNDARFPAVFGMPALATTAQAEGYTVFFLTGRPEVQRPGTVTNLTNVGFAAPDADHLFMKNAADPPAYLACGATCTTVQYKSGTRAHIESLGYDIVANFGDQYSDLLGGYADRTFKLPNPMYFLP